MRSGKSKAEEHGREEEEESAKQEIRREGWACPHKPQSHHFYCTYIYFHLQRKGRASICVRSKIVDLAS